MNKQEIKLAIELEKAYLNSIDETDCYKKILLILNNYFIANNCAWIYGDKCKRNIDTLILYNEKELEKDQALYILLDEYGYIILDNPQKTSNNVIEFIKYYLKNIEKFFIEINKLKERLYTDSLTKVSNNEALTELMKNKKEYINVGVCFIDANGLGIINNTYGHEAGDKLLITISSCMMKHIRKNDIYRKSGDEFIIISENISKELFIQKIQMLKELISHTPYSISIGISYSNKTNNIMDLIKEADNRMYIEKEEYRKNNPSKYLIKKKD